MKDKVFGVLQRVGRSFMLPIALLPVAGLLLGIGSSFTNPTTIETYGLVNVIKEGGILYTIGAVLYGLGIKKRSYMHCIFHVFVLLERYSSE